MHVFAREAGIEKALLHGRGAGCYVALGGVGGIDFDELLEDFPGFSAVGGRGGHQGVLGDGDRSNEETEGSSRDSQTHVRIVRGAAETAWSRLADCAACQQRFN